MPICGDDAVRLGDAVRSALNACDLLLTIGGVSKGTHDLVQEVLQEHGVQRVFHGLDIKPGKPTFFGRAPRVGGDAFVFGLPGNPASCFTIFEVLVRSAIDRLHGWREATRVATTSTARLAEPVSGNARMQVLPGRLRSDANGVSIEPLPLGPSASPLALAQGGVLFRVPAGSAGLGSGAVVPYDAY
jgi:molybdopterin molybdotransferase